MSEVIQVRVPHGTKTSAKKVATKLRYESPSGFYRSVILEALTGYPSLDATRYGEIRRLHHQIHKIGVNLNQIAHALNMDRRPSDHEIRRLVNEVRELTQNSLNAYGSLLRKTRNRK